MVELQDTATLATDLDLAATDGSAGLLTIAWPVRSEWFFGCRDNRHGQERRGIPVPRCRKAKRTAPGVNLLRQDIVLSRNGRNTQTARRNLKQDCALLLFRPTTAALDPRQYLYPPHPNPRDVTKYGISDVTSAVRRKSKRPAHRTLTHEVPSCVFSRLILAKLVLDLPERLPFDVLHKEDAEPIVDVGRERFWATAQGLVTSTRLNIRKLRHPVVGHFQGSEAL